MANGFLSAQPYYGLAGSAIGSNPAFSLGQNFTFEDLAKYEEQRRKAANKEIQDKLAARRAMLSESLTKQGRDLFNLKSPQMLEDLNAKGVFTSETARNQAEADALKEIALSNQRYLNEFDTAATGIDVANDQASLENILDIRRSELENQLQEGQANREQDFATNLASQQRKQGLLESLIGVGGTLGGAYLMSRGGGAGVPGVAGSTAGGGAFGGFGGGSTASNVLGGNATPLGKLLMPSGAASSTGAFSPMTAFKAGGLGGAAAGAGLGLLGSSLGRNVFGGGNDAGSVAGGALGYTLGGPVGAGVGSFLGTGAQRLGEQAYEKSQKALGNTVASTLKPILNPVGAVKSISKSIKKAFCFDGLTPVEMADGTIKPICEVDLDDNTKGGVVESIRVSKTDDGTVYKYKGIMVTGMHAVKEDGYWIRVKDSPFSELVPGEDTVFSIVTSNHRIFSNGIEFADEQENDGYENLTIDQSLAELNKNPVGVN